MSVYKKRKIENGESKQFGGWMVESSDHVGHLRRVYGFNDRTASVELERHIRRLVELRKVSLGPDAELSRFLETCPNKVRDKLAFWDIIDGECAAAGKEIEQHIEEWRDSMAARGFTNAHVKEYTAKMLRIFGARSPA